MKRALIGLVLTAVVGVAAVTEGNAADRSADGQTPPLMRSQNPHGVRVLILEGKPSLKLTVMKEYRVVDPATGKVLAASKKLAGVNVRSRAGGLLVAGVKFPESIEVHSTESADLFIDNKPFRGFVSIHRLPDGSLMAVNHIDVEDYLYGVLFHEVGSWWPMEALKAQAIAARTYALHQKRSTAGRRFDVYSNQSSQMYGGADSERNRSNRAVDETRGQVLTYQGDLFPAYYHAACGGLTRDSSELWKIQMPPLAGGVRCESCWFSPHYSWHAKIAPAEMEKILVDRGIRVGVIREMSVETRSPSERALTVRIKGDSGERVISAKDLRLWVGPTVVRSEQFELHQRWGKFVFEGKGWGHGVGMCQWGTLGQSIVGKKFAEILSFYYPGSSIAQVYEDPQ